MGNEWNEGSNSPGERRTRELEHAIEAAAKHRIVTGGELRGAGLSRDQILYRLRVARLCEVHRAVYAIGPAPLALTSRWMAAVRVGGDDALLTGRAGAALWGMLPWVGPRIDVVAPSRRRPRPHVRFHRAEVAEDERSVRNEIPVVCPARAILDLATVVGGRPLERALNEARVLRLPPRPTLAALIERYPGKPGIRAARGALELFTGGATPTRSELEERFLGLLDDSELPRPLLNRLVRTEAGVFRVDCIWPGRRVIVELDGYATHSSRRSMREDRRRDRALRIAGWDPSRVTWDDLADPIRLLAEIRALLGARVAIDEPRDRTLRRR